MRCPRGHSVLGGGPARGMGFREGEKGTLGETLGLEWRNMYKRLGKIWLR